MTTGAKLPAIPAQWPGSDLEWYVFQALLSLGYRYGADFEYQVPLSGGRLDRGGAVADFTLPDLRVGLNPIGRYWHVRTAGQRSHDALQRAMLEGQGWRVEYPQEDDVLSNARDTVRRCINGTYGRGPVGI